MTRITEDMKLRPKVNNIFFFAFFSSYQSFSDKTALIMSKEESVRQMNSCFDAKCDPKGKSAMSLTVETSGQQLLQQLPQKKVFGDNKQCKVQTIPKIIIEESDISTQFQRLEEGVEKLITTDGTDSCAGSADKITIRWVFAHFALPLLSYLECSAANDRVLNIITERIVIDK